MVTTLNCKPSCERGFACPGCPILVQNVTDILPQASLKLDEVQINGTNINSISGNKYLVGVVIEGELITSNK